VEEENVFVTQDHSRESDESKLQKVGRGAKIALSQWELGPFSRLQH
jgi:restriction endonuclease